MRIGLSAAPSIPRMVRILVRATACDKAAQARSHVVAGNAWKSQLRTRATSSLSQRIASAYALARHPRIDITSFEASPNTRYTAA
jgi:hypothetical protein